MSDPEDEKETDFSGVMISLVLLPVSLVVNHFGNADMAVSTFFFLGVIVFAAKIKWDLRKHIWFWMVLVIVTVLHVPLIMSIYWPAHSVHKIFLMPLFIADLLIVFGILRLVEKMMPGKQS